jgi:hypothetical protein
MIFKESTPWEKIGTVALTAAQAKHLTLFVQR